MKTQHILFCSYEQKGCKTIGLHQGRQHLTKPVDQTHKINSKLSSDAQEHRTGEEERGDTVCVQRCINCGGVIKRLYSLVKGEELVYCNVDHINCAQLHKKG